MERTHHPGMPGLDQILGGRNMGGDAQYYCGHNCCSRPAVPKSDVWLNVSYGEGDEEVQQFV